MIPRLCPPIRLRELGLVVTAKGSVGRFEEAFAQLAGTKHAVAFPYGRTALMCLLEALELKDRDIITPSYTCVVVPHAVVYSGNAPVFVDCAPGSYLMDMALASDAVTETTGAIIATSFFGEPVSLEAIDAFQRAHPQVAVIQDCAHSFFCEDGGKPVHKHGIAAIYGLNISKLITSVFGGMVTTDDDALAARLRTVRTSQITPSTLAKSISRRLYLIASRIALSSPAYGAVQWLSSLGVLNRFIRYYNDSIIDMPRDYLTGLSDFEAAIGTAQCARYAEVVAHRRTLAEQYLTGLSDCSHLTLPKAVPGHTWSHFTLRTGSAAAYVEVLARHGIEAGTMLEYFIPSMPAYQSHRHIDKGIARSYIGQTVNLPLHYFVSAEDAQRVIALMRVKR